MSFTVIDQPSKHAQFIEEVERTCICPPNLENFYRIFRTPPLWFINWTKASLSELLPTLEISLRIYLWPVDFFCLTEANLNRIALVKPIQLHLHFKFLILTPLHRKLIPQLLILESQVFNLLLGRTQLFPELCY